MATPANQVLVDLTLSCGHRVERVPVTVGAKFCEECGQVRSITGSTLSLPANTRRGRVRRVTLAPATDGALVERAAKNGMTVSRYIAEAIREAIDRDRFAEMDAEAEGEG